MIPQQLKAILILRWQMSRNQWRRAGTLNAVLATVAVVAVAIAGVMSFFGALIAGCLLLSQAQPDHVLILWDVVTVGFLAFWTLGLLTELQRSELFSLDKLLHLPVSLSGAYLLNYLSSWFSLSLVLFLPLTMGLSLAFVVTHGVKMLLLFPLVFSLIFLVTGVTYQLRGWLAQLMQNKRRRGTVIAVITISFIILSQAPNYISLYYTRSLRNASHESFTEQQRQMQQLQEDLKDQRISPEEYSRQMTELINAGQESRADNNQTSWEHLLGWLRLANMILPIGWLPYGAYSLTLGNILYAVLGAAGMFGLGSASLWRSYRITIRGQTGAIGEAPRPAAPATTTPVSRPTNKTLFVSRQIAGLSDQVAAIAITSFCSLLRSPEAKMMFLTPIIFIGIFGSTLLLGPRQSFPPEAVPFLYLVGIGTSLLTTAQFLFNAFGFERGGFRAYILAPVSRRDILLGKNLSLVPVVLGLNVLLLILIAAAFPVRITHLPAVLIQAVNAYLLICLGGNLLSIRFPVTLPTAGALRPQNIRMGTVLLHFAMGIISPLVLIPAVFAWGVEFLVEYLTDFKGVPWFLLLSAAEAPLIALIYWQVLAEEGKLLQKRETHILQIVAAASE